MLGTDAASQLLTETAPIHDCLLHAGAMVSCQIPRRNIFLPYFTVEDTSAQGGKV